MGLIQFSDSEYIGGKTSTTHFKQMRLFNLIATAAAATSVSFIATNPALASNIKTGHANGSEIHYLQNAESGGVDYLAIPNAPAGDHRIVVNCSQGKILGSKGPNSKNWEKSVADSYCSTYR